MRVGGGGVLAVVGIRRVRAAGVVVADGGAGGDVLIDGGDQVEAAETLVADGEGSTRAEALLVSRDSSGASRRSAGPDPWW